MSILLDENSKVLVQGFTGQIGTFHATEMIEYGILWAVSHRAKVALDIWIVLYSIP
jgi:succinyl-CoA synthetase alpha subunit